MKNAMSAVLEFTIPVIVGFIIVLVSNSNGIIVF